MSNFKVKYRAKDGAVAAMEIEATDRMECVSRCKERGISPVSIDEMKESLNGRTGETGKPHLKPGFIKYAFVAAVMVFITAGVTFWLFRSDDRSVSAETKSIPLLKTSVKRTGINKTKTAQPKKPEKTQEVIHAGKVFKGPKPGTIISVETNDNDLVITAIVGADGKTNLHTKAVNPPVFSNPSDQLIAAVMSASMTGEMAPLPLGPETDAMFKAALKKPILDNPEDSEEIKRMKQLVRNARGEIAQLMEEGMSVAEVLEQHRTLWNENIKVRNDVIAEYRKIVSSGDAEGAAQYLNTMNTSLGQMGIPPLTESDGFPKRRKRRREQ